MGQGCIVMVVTNSANGAPFQMIWHSIWDKPPYTTAGASHRGLHSTSGYPAPAQLVDPRVPLALPSGPPPGLPPGPPPGPPPSGPPPHASAPQLVRDNDELEVEVRQILEDRARESTASAEQVQRGWTEQIQRRNAILV